MPLYEYKCNECNETFEVLQRFNDEPLETCIHCKGKVEKLISASSFQLKGSGWYVTDYKNKKRTNSELNSGSNKNATIK